VSSEQLPVSRATMSNATSTPRNTSTTPCVGGAADAPGHDTMVAGGLAAHAAGSATKLPAPVSLPAHIVPDTGVHRVWSFLAPSPHTVHVPAPAPYIPPGCLHVGNPAPPTQSAWQKLGASKRYSVMVSAVDDPTESLTMSATSQNPPGVEAREQGRRLYL